MTIPPQIENMAKGLVVHFLQGRTIEQAIEEGREVGMPGELLDSLPGMVFQATSAAGAIHVGERTMAHQVLKVMVKRGAAREDAEHLVKLVLGFIAELEAEIGPDKPVPNSGGRWFEYGGQPRTNHVPLQGAKNQEVPVESRVRPSRRKRIKDRSRRNKH